MKTAAIILHPQTKPAQLRVLREKREDSYLSTDHDRTNRLTLEIIKLEEEIKKEAAIDSGSAFKSFYADPTPARAVRLALQDYKALAKPCAMPGELADQLHAAEKACELHEELAEAVRAYVRARTDGGVSMADLSGIADQKLRDVCAKL